MSLHLLVVPFLNLSTKELVQLRALLKEVNFNNLDPIAQEERDIFFPLKVGLFILAER
jgi:hypothetical protein